jgi:hypothetical protein
MDLVERCQSRNSYEGTAMMMNENKKTRMLLASKDTPLEVYYVAEVVAASLASI